MFLARVCIATSLFAAVIVPAHADDSKWGAIAVDKAAAELEPYYGVGNAETEKEASDTAVGFCKDVGGTDCQTVITYELCGALAVTGKGTGGWGKSDTKDGAEKQALEGCEDASCKIVVSDCKDDS